MPRYSFSPSTASSSSPPPSSSSSSLSSLYTMRTSQHASPHTMNDVGDHPLLSFSSSSSAYGYYDLIGSKFAHPLSLYQHLPDTSSVPLSTFEEITVNRLRVLNFLHEKFGTETSLSPSFLRGDHTLSSRGRPSLSSSSASSSSTVKNASAASSPGSIGMGSSLSSGGHQQRTTGEGELKELLIETGLMLDISAGVGRGTGAVGGSLVGSVYTPEQRRKLAMRDAISHFALRLAFSSDRERQQWFIRQECRLFLYRLDELMRSHPEATGVASEDLPFNQFLQREGLEYDFVTRPSKREEFSLGMTIWKRATEFRSDFAGPYAYQESRLFLVPFYPDAASLVARRRVYVHRSIAYVPFTDMDQVLLNKFRSILTESFSLLGTRQLSVQMNVFGDPRIGSLLAAIPTAYVGKEFRRETVETAEDRLTPQNVKEVWKFSFPPCMRRLFGAYLRDRHMRHSGRLQLWLFFKGAGMRMEENLQFNRAMWQDSQKFDKEHAYTIRHIYGQEGKRAEYPPLSCTKIISGGGMLQTPGVGDFHGCPFKHFDKPQLQKLLSEFGLNYNEMIPILKYKDTNEYQLACREYFLQTHPGSEGEGVGNHPNSFYEVSRRYSRKQQQKQENPQNSKEGRGEREEKNERRKSDNGGSSDRTNPSQGLGDVPMD